MRILLFGSATEGRAALEVMLGERGHTVHACEKEEQAWSTYEHERPSVIVLADVEDAHLALTRRVRAVPDRDTMIVAFPSRCSPEQLEAALEAGVDDCFSGGAEAGQLSTRFAFVEKRAAARLERVQDERRLTTQYIMANVLTESDSLMEAGPRILQTICEQLDWDWGEFWMPDGEGEYLECVEVYSNASVSLPGFETAARRTVFARMEGLPGSVWEEKHPKWMSDVTQHTNFIRVQAAKEAGMQTGFAFPIRLGATVFGVLVFFSREPREPDEGLLQMFSVLGNQIGQFAERRQAREALLKSAERLRRAQEIARLGSWEYDLTSKEVVLSDQMYRILGLDPGVFTLDLETVQGFFPAEDWSRFERTLKDAVAERTSCSMEHRLVRRGGAERWVLSQAELTAAGRVLAGTTLDITELKRAKKALWESEAKARAIVETTVEGIITVDEQGRIETFNPGAETIFGYEAEEVIGENVKILMPSPYREEHDAYIHSYLESGEAKIIGIGRETVGRRKDGTTFPIDLAVSEVQLGGRRIFTGVIRDITERRRLEKEIMNVTEQERRRIGQDLHDGLGQMLTGIGLLGQNLTRQLEKRDVPEAEDAAEITELVKDADQYARDLARGLTPVDLEASGLVAALKRLVSNAERLFDVECVLEEVGSGLVHNGTAATHMYRIAQEAVSNAVRHGKAERIKVSLASGSEKLRLRIQDDGVGFSEADRDGSEEGMGVRIMNYRARIVGGTLDISSTPGDGTAVTCTLPNTASMQASEDEVNT